MNVNFPIGLGAAQFIAVSDSGLLSKFRFVVNQIMQALVVEVSNDNVIVSLDGRLVAAKSEVPLYAGQILTLQVKESTQNQVLMRLMPQDGNLWRPITDQDLTNLLDTLQLPSDGLNRQIVRQLMSQGFDLSRGNVLDVRESFPQGLVAHESAMEAAVFLRSFGLPVTEETIQMVISQWALMPDRGGQLKDLESAIRSFLHQLDFGQTVSSGNTALRSLLADTLVKLENLRLQPESGNSQSVSRELARLLQSLGDSPEGKMMRLLIQGQEIRNLDDEQGLLAKLLLEAKGRSSIANEPLGRELGRVQDEAGRFLQGIRFEQLLNSANFVNGGQDGSYFFSIPISDNGNVRTLKLRITPEEGGEDAPESQKGMVKVELEMDLSVLGQTSISLSFLQRSVQCHFANSNPNAIDWIRRSSDQLRDELGRSGFEVSSISFGQTVVTAADPPPSVGQVIGTFRIDIRA